MAGLPIIVSLSDSYFPNDPDHSELLLNKGERRPYVQGTVISDESNDYFVPFRSYLPIKALESSPEAFLPLPTKSKPHAGLDIRKMVVLDSSVPLHVQQRSIASSQQYRQLKEKQDELWEKVEGFISDYKAFAITRQQNTRTIPPDKFKYTTLQYYHEELGISNPSVSTQRTDSENIRNAIRRRRKQDRER